jgi:hypothetical protein
LKREDQRPVEREVVQLRAPLCLAVREGITEVVKVLLEQPGIKINYPADDPPCLVAVENGFTDIAEPLLQTSKVDGSHSQPDSPGGACVEALSLSFGHADPDRNKSGLEIVLFSIVYNPSPERTPHLAATEHTPHLARKDDTASPPQVH